MLIEKNDLNTILNSYPEDKRKLLNGQINCILDFILANKDLYSSSVDFNKAVDLILTLVLKGEFLKENEI